MAVSIGQFEAALGFSQVFIAPSWPELETDFFASVRVYFARSGQLLKIGESHNPAQRAQTLQRETGHEHRIVLAIDGCRRRQHELFLHHALKAERVHGEYFRGSKTEALLAALCQLGGS